MNKTSFPLVVPFMQAPEGTEALGSGLIVMDGMADGAEALALIMGGISEADADGSALGAALVMAGALLAIVAESMGALLRAGMALVALIAAVEAAPPGLLAAAEAVGITGAVAVGRPDVLAEGCNAGVVVWLSPAPSEHPKVQPRSNQEKYLRSMVVRFCTSRKPRPEDMIALPRRGLDVEE